jgi:formylmethanofuran dehydrogenase subunit E
MGTKMTLAAMKYLGLDPNVKNKNLIVYAEIDRCMTDAIQVITGCTLGHRTLKYVDYGKFAATFVNLTSHKAVRATIRESCEIKGAPEEVVEKMANLPESEVVNIQEVEVNIPETSPPPSRLTLRYSALRATNSLFIPTYRSRHIIAAL